MRRAVIASIVAVAVLFVADQLRTSSQPVDLSGRWSGRTLTGIKVILDLNPDRSVLHGTLTRHRPSPITDGHVGDRGFTFQAKLGRTNEHFTGWFVGNDRIRVSIDGPLGVLTRITFHRVGNGT